MNSRMMLELSNYENDEFTIALSVPASDYEVQDALDQIRAYGDNARCNISIVSCPMLPELVGARVDCVNVYEMNYFAHRLKNIADNETDYAILKAVKHKVIPEDVEGEVISMKDLINLTYGLDDVSVVSNIANDAQLGQFVIENEMEDYITELPESVIEKLDREVIGASFRKKDGGVISDGRYVLASEFELPDVYDESQKPWEEVKSNFVFKVITTNAPWETTDDLEGRIFELNMPMSDEDMANMVKRMRLSDISRAEYITMESTVTGINDFNFSGKKDFVALNDIARLYAEMSPVDKAKFKAAVTVENEHNTVPNANRLLEIATHIDQYEFDSSIKTDREYMLKYLSMHMDSRMDLDMFEDMDAYRPARNIMHELGCHISSYGLISKQDGSLYALITHDGIVEVDDNEKALRRALEKSALDLSDNGRTPIELSKFIEEVSAMVEGPNKTAVLDWIEYANFMVDCDSAGKTYLEKELAEIYYPLCYVKHNFDNATLQRTLKSIGCPNEIIFRAILNLPEINEDVIDELANQGHLMDGYIPSELTEKSKLKFIFVDDDEGDIFIVRNPQVDSLGYMTRAANFFEKNESDYRACLKDQTLCGNVIRHISDPTLREAIKYAFFNSDAIGSMVIYTPCDSSVVEYQNDDYPDNIDEILDYQGLGENGIIM